MGSAKLRLDAFDVVVRSCRGRVPKVIVETNRNMKDKFDLSRHAFSKEIS